MVSVNFIEEVGPYSLQMAVAMGGGGVEEVARDFILRGES